MTGLDTNVLVAALVSTSANHVKALRSLDMPGAAFCTTPTNVGETLRLLTHPRVFERPLKLTKAVSLFLSFVEAYNIMVLDEPTDWWQDLPEVEQAIHGLKGNEIFDARIALCLKCHGVRRMLTWDSDFKKYSFLSIVT